MIPIKIDVTDAGDGAGGKIARIGVSGRFDFNLHRDFRTAYEGVKGNNVHYVVDMSNVSYIDSSALGMLLILRENVGGETRRIKIIGCNPDIQKTLLIANFGQLFDIQ